MNLTIDGNHITFSSGLNRALTRSCNQINVKHVETLLQSKSVHADFQMNKEVQGKVGAAVTYKADNFNPITINEAFDM